MSDEPKKIPGMRFVAELPEGAEWRVFNDRIIVCAPNEQPYFQNDDGSREYLKIEDVPGVVHVLWGSTSLDPSFAALNRKSNGPE
jgi:hypothetical protein